MFYLGKDANMHTTKMCEELKIDSLYLVIWTIAFFFLWSYETEKRFLTLWGVGRKKSEGL